MSAIRHTHTQSRASLRASASGDVDELEWPPSIDDLNAIEVVPIAAYAREPTRPMSASNPAGPSSLPSLSDLLAVHELDGVDADTFRSEATTGVAEADGLLPSEERGLSWTHRALFAAAAVFVLMTIGPLVWTSAVSPEVPQVAELLPTAPTAAPLVAPESARSTALENVPGGTQAVSPAEHQPVTPVALPVERQQVTMAVPAPAAPRGPDVMSTPSPPLVRPESQRVLEPESQRVLVPAPQPVRPAETMARTAVPLVTPSGALAPLATAPLAMAPTPAAAPRNIVDTALAATATPTRAAPVPDRSDEVRVQAALQRFESAYSRLDARAAQAVWPSVDARALAQAFESLESQSVQFDRCKLDVQESVARADCAGTATYVRRIGSKTPRTEPRAWTFNLRKTGDAWQILSAAAR